MAENTTAVLTAAATDADAGDTITYTLTGADAAKFDVSATGEVTFKTAPNYEVDAKTYSFNIVATDSGTTSKTATQAVTVTVTDVNEAPVAAATATATVAENSTAVGTYTTTDPDAGDVLTYSLSGADAAKFSISAAGVVAFVAAPNFEVDAKSYAINVVATDKAGLTASQAVTINVTDVNEAPTAGAAATATVAENSTAVGTYAAADVDAGDSLTYTLSGTDAAKFTVGADGAVAFATAPNFEKDATSYSINVVATDKAGLASTQAVTVGVTNVNEAPVAVDDKLATQALANNNTYVIDIAGVMANDTDVDAGDTLSIVSVQAGVGGSVSLNGGTKVVYIADSAAIREGSFTYTIKDAGGLTSTATASFIINSAPVGTAGTAAATEDTAFTGAVAATDVNGDTMTYAVGTTTAKGVLVLAADGSYTYTPNANYNGTDSFTFTATDKYSAVSTATTVNITVASVNDAPSGTASALSVKAGAATATTGSLTVADVDLDPALNAVVDTLTYTVDSTGTIGTVTIDAATGVYSYTPTAAQQGATTDSFKVTVTDKAGLSATSTVTANLTNTAPVATDFALTAKTGVTQTVDLTGKATDAEGQTLTPTVIVGSVSSGGSAEVVGGKIVYTSTIGFVGTETVKYTVADGYGGTSAVQTITFTVASNTGGTSGDDLLYGSTAAEAIDGLAGADTIVGGGGADTISGSAGNDVITFNDNAKQILGGDDIDTLVINSDAIAAKFDLSSATDEASMPKAPPLLCAVWKILMAPNRATQSPLMQRLLQQPRFCCRNRQTR
ncbi:MAG: tandem-95 repeat protein [Burkholderiales bacterium]|nr:tandem-95 repeat protein [Burkholderiales bacterium]